MSLTGWLFPDSVAALTVAAFVAAVIWWPRLAGRGRNHIVARVGMLLGINLLVLLTAAIQLNAQFLFFADWTDLAGAFGGASTSTALARGTSASKAANHTVTGSAASAAATLPPLPQQGVSATGIISY